MAQQYIYTMVNLQKVVPPRREILKGIYLAFFPGAKIGVLGLNGAGKSSLLRIMAGVDTEFNGEAFAAEGTRVGFLAQDPWLDPAKTVLENVEAAVAPVKKLLARFDELGEKMGESLPDDEMDKVMAEYGRVQDAIEAANGWDLDRTLETAMDALRCPPPDADVTKISGGERRRVALCRVLLEKPDLLLLDEPTNHLDAAGLEFLESWLVERKASAEQAALVVSHDRHFLNAVADRIVEVSHGLLEEYPGDYDSYRKRKAERDRVRAKAAEEQRRLVERTEEFIRRNIAGQKTKQAQARRKMLARLERVEAPREDANEVAFRFEEARATGDRVLELKGLVPGYPETGPLLEPVSFLLRRGDRVALRGPNGCGKTTLLRSMARVLPPLAGTAVPGAGVLVGYYDQEMRDLPGSRTVLDVVRDLDPTLLDGEARDFLALFDFRGEEVAQRVSTLSGGEKGRLSLARIVFGGANLLLLDEPTNHLDLDARERLEEALLDFEGTIVFVSHDRWFVDRIATHVLEVRGRVATLEPGNYTDGLRRRAAEMAAEAGGPRGAPVDAGPRAARRPDRHAERQRAKAKREVDALEEEVARLEERIASIDGALAAPDAWRDGPKTRELTLSRDEARGALEETLAAWEAAVRRLEEEVPA